MLNTSIDFKKTYTAMANINSTKTVKTALAFTIWPCRHSVLIEIEKYFWGSQRPKECWAPTNVPSKGDLEDLVSKKMGCERLHKLAKRKFTHVKKKYAGELEEYCAQCPTYLRKCGNIMGIKWQVKCPSSLFLNDVHFNAKKSYLNITGALRTELALKGACIPPRRFRFL